MHKQLTIGTCVCHVQQYPQAQTCGYHNTVIIAGVIKVYMYLFSIKAVSVFLFPLVETLSLDCSSTVMTHEVVGVGEDGEETAEQVVSLPLVAMEGCLPELDSR